MMLGVHALPAALTDVAALLRVIADPKAAKAALDAIAKAAAGLEAQRADLTEREQKIAAEIVANNGWLAQIAAEQNTLYRERDSHGDRLAAIEAARDRLAVERDAHTKLLAENVARKKQADGVVVQIEAKQVEYFETVNRAAKEAAGRAKALDDREAAVAQGEADLKAKVADWKRVTKALAA